MSHRAVFTGSPRTPPVPSERRAAYCLQVGAGRFCDSFLNEPVVKPDAELVVEDSKKNRPFISRGSLDQRF